MSVRGIHRTLSSLTPQQRALFARRLAEDGLSGDSLDILPRPATGEPVPASLMQQRLWILDQMEPGNPFYNLPLLCFRLRGPLRLDVLDRSFREIERRHEGLRTVFAPGDPVPLQVVLQAGRHELPLVDLSALPAERGEETAWALAREEGRWLFDLACGPLWRTSLVRVAPDDHLLFVLMHHIISDAWSLGVFYRELTILHGAFLQGLPSPLPEPPIQYPDFAIWQRSQLQGERLAEEVGFWREQLAGAPDLLELPWDRPRPAQRTFGGERLTARFSPELAEAVAGLSATAGASLFIVLLAAFDALLHRWSGQDDIVLGFPVAGRTLPTEGLIGFFVNTVALRVRLGGDPSFRELLARTRNVVLDVFEHQELPFDRLVEELNPRRDPAWSPVFQVMMSLQNTPTPDLDLPGLEVTPYGVSSGTAQTDLIFFAGMEKGRLGLLHLEYNTGLFDTTTMQRMERHLLRLLAAAAADPDLALSRLPLLSAAEAHQLSAEWGGGTLGEAPLSGPCIHEAFAAQARQRSGETAVTCDGISWTYRELDRRANALAHHLAALGVRPGSRVGLCIEPGLAMITALFGILKAGGAYVPLDPGYPAERMAFLLEDALASEESPLVLTGAGLAGRIPPGHATVVELDEDLLASEADEPPAASVSPGHTAYVIYTSGSTGRPKGVVNTHANLVRFLDSALPAFGLMSTDVWCLFHAFTFDFSVWEIFGALLSGGRLVIFPRDIARSAPNLLCGLAASEVTVLNQTPAALYQLVDAATETTLPTPLALRLVVAGGESLDTGRLAPWFAGSCREEPLLVNVYGITETTILSTSRRSDWRDPSIGRRIGRPFSGISLHVLGPHGERSPIGIPGEICLGGQGVARGYLGRPELTAAKFVPDPFSAVPGSRLYRSGDLARHLPDGDIEFLGRIDHQVKLRGFRIELGEIEAALARHPGVRDCVAAVRETGSGDPGIVAWYVPVPGSAPEPAELRAFLLQSLPEHMIPVVFMPLAALPWTSSGKVDRKALPAPERAGARRGAETAAPRTPLEETLVELWKELLGVAQVDREDDFFELGGHSLVATRLTSRLRDRLQIEVPPQLVFQNPRLAALAGSLERVRERGSRPEAPALTALPRRVRRAG